MIEKMTPADRSPTCTILTMTLLSRLSNWNPAPPARIGM